MEFYIFIAFHTRPPLFHTGTSARPNRVSKVKYITLGQIERRGEYLTLPYLPSVKLVYALCPTKLDLF